AGTPIVGETWRVLVNNVAVASHLTSAVDADGNLATPGTRTENAAEIAQALATTINNAAGYAATVTGATIIIVSDTDSALSMQTAIVPAGSATTSPAGNVTSASVNLAGSAIAGETWTLNLKVGPAVT